MVHCRVVKKPRRTDLKIPYGVSDFRTIRNEGLYYIDKTRYLALMESRDRFIFFVRPRRFGKSLFISMMESYYDLNQKKAELEAQRKEGIAQLKNYAKDKKIPALAKDTTLHLILVQYRGPKMANCELVGEKKY